MSSFPYWERALSTFTVLSTHNNHIFDLTKIHMQSFSDPFFFLLTQKIVLSIEKGPDIAMMNSKHAWKIHSIQRLSY